MATLCPNCGAELPQANARFCSKCGISLSKPPVSNAAPARTPLPPSAARPAQPRSQSPLREQIAQQPGPSPRPSVPPTPPEKSASLPYEQVAERRMTPMVPKRPQSPLPVPPSEGTNNAPATNSANAIEPMQAKRELRVKVWPEEDAQSKSEFADSATQTVPHEEIEDVPTHPLTLDAPPEPIMSAMSPLPKPIPTPIPAIPRSQPPIEQLDTIPMMYKPAPSPVVPSTPVGQIAQANRQTEPPFYRRRAIIVPVLLALLIIIGVSVWAAILQPFSVPAVTAPQQSFQDTQLGFRLLYPNGWSTSIDRHTATAHFADSTHTAQVNVTVTNATGLAAAVYLAKEATQLGMTGTKAGPLLTFAGATWQQIQGSVQQNGASYTETILVTVHGSHLFTLTQAAPQSIYAQEEHLVFASMRSSMHFLG